MNATCLDPGPRLLRCRGLLPLLLLFTFGSVARTADPVPHIPPPAAWSGFRIFVWQYETRAEIDRELYRAAGLQGFHIDYGAGQESRVRFAQEQRMPYYVDHAAGKGILHLTERTGKDELERDGLLQPRPKSLADPDVIRELHDQLRRNVPPTLSLMNCAYALDDEVSLGVMNSPIEVDGSPAAIASYRKWLRERYTTLEALNAQWGTKHTSFAEIQPTTYGEIRASLADRPFSAWNLAPWLDWRSFNDSLFAETLGSLVRETNRLAPGIPGGVVGGQQPSAYGGFDYEKLCPQLQWIEAYDIGGTNEILRSFWSGANARPRVQTFFSSGDARADRWFLWYYYLHGNRAVIAWPDRKGQGWFEGGKVAPVIAANRDAFVELQGELGSVLCDESLRFDDDGIAVLYSHPSIQAGWAADALVHGKTWPRRSSSLDDTCQTAAKNRVAWFKLLEDCGYQYRVIGCQELVDGLLERQGYRVLVLPRCLALSDAECDAIRRFAHSGGWVIADYWTALLDAHGTGRPVGGLDDLFGITRDASRGYFDGKTLAEVDGEKGNRPFLERLPPEPVTRRAGLRVVELGTRPAAGGSAPAAFLDHPVGDGRAIYLNASPVEYWDNTVRLGPTGVAWRRVMAAGLANAGIVPDFGAVHAATGEPLPLTEVLRWRAAERVVVAVVRNPTRRAAIDSMGELLGFEQESVPLELRVPASVEAIVELRSGRRYRAGDPVTVDWQPWEGLLFEVQLATPSGAE